MAKNQTMIEVFSFNVAENHVPEECFHDLLQHIPDSERDRILKYKFRKDQLLSLFGLLLVKYRLGSIQGLHRTELGKPLLPDQSKQFSISHAGDFVVCAFYKEEIGIDIELIKEIEFNDFRLVYRSEEIEGIRSLVDFYKLWTQKEAIIKGLGTGFSVNPTELIIHDLCCTFDRKKWYLKRFEVDRDYEGHIASRSLTEISHKSLNLNGILLGLTGSERT